MDGMIHHVHRWLTGYLARGATLVGWSALFYDSREICVLCALFKYTQQAAVNVILCCPTDGWVVPRPVEAQAINWQQRTYLNHDAETVAFIDPHSVPTWFSLQTVRRHRPWCGTNARPTESYVE